MRKGSRKKAQAKPKKGNPTKKGNTANQIMAWAAVAAVVVAIGAWYTQCSASEETLRARLAIESIIEWPPQVVGRSHP